MERSADAPIRPAPGPSAEPGEPAPDHGSPADGTPDRARPSVCVVGPGKRFLSGLTYYTYALVDLLAARRDTSVVLIRQLLPERFYPGRDHVGGDLTHLRLPARVPRCDGVDWYWLPSLVRALWFLRRERPDVLLVQWWTAAALHTQVVLALAARLLGGRVVVELHEVIDRGEAQHRWVRLYARLASPLLFRQADRFIVHSEHDRRSFCRAHRLDPASVEVVPHLVTSHYHLGFRHRPAPDDCCNILCFGVIRPFKGVEDLVDAFDAIPPDQIDNFWLTIVGETWEGWTVPAERIERSRYRDRITFVNRYVTDEEVDGYFAGADLVALPYRSSSMSGPLHVAMSYGLPVITTRVGGLPEVVDGYDGGVLVDPGDPVALSEALVKVEAAGRRHHQPPPTAGDDTAAAYTAVVDVVGGAARGRRELARR